MRKISNSHKIQRILKESQLLCQNGKIYRNTKSHSWDETIDDLSKKIRSE